MSKLYIFAIGGTGARVLRSLTMLLSAGVKINTDEIVPVIIDPDKGNGNMTDTKNLMDWYSQIYNTQNQGNNRDINSFNVKLTKLPFPTDYIMPIGDNTNKLFEDYMNTATLDQNNQAMVNMLFSDKNQKTDMTIGFTGNPNIGSVILNQISSNREFIDFASTFNHGDKIFIISSIFGGTGASGFPLLLKTFRDLDAAIPNANDIQKAMIGAITVLPYFNIQPATDPDAPIDSNTFISKTKSALHYYEHNLNGLDALYYIGDNATGLLPYNDGGISQRNNAHFVELAAALSIIDFLKMPGATGNTIYKEFGIKSDANVITLPDLGPTTYNEIARPLTEFTLFCKFLNEKLNESLSQTWALSHSDGIGANEFQTITQLATEFIKWIDEMNSSEHTQRFAPFILSPNPDNVFGFAKGLETKRVFKTASNWDLYNVYLNDIQEKKTDNLGKNASGRVLAHLLYGTKKVVNDKIRL